jgi:hypothetical protein
MHFNPNTGRSTYSGGVLPRVTILAEWLRHFNDLEVGETAAPAYFFAGERSATAYISFQPTETCA